MTGVGIKVQGDVFTEVIEKTVSDPLTEGTMRSFMIESNKMDDHHATGQDLQSLMQFTISVVQNLFLMQIMIAHDCSMIVTSACVVTLVLSSALSAAVHGYSKATDMENMTNELHLQLAKLQVSVWFEWVPSLANISDLPSRIETSSEFAYYKALDIQEWPGAFQLPSPDTVAHEDLDTLKWLTGD
jgi:hypothetical protein